YCIGCTDPVSVSASSHVTVRQSDMGSEVSQLCNHTGPATYTVPAFSPSLLSQGIVWAVGLGLLATTVARAYQAVWRVRSWDARLRQRLGVGTHLKAE
ncbi:hypothetical protein KIPB_012913, partial [Kipferlia bialata]